MCEIPDHQSCPVDLGARNDPSWAIEASRSEQLVYGDLITLQLPAPDSHGATQKTEQPSTARSGSLFLSASSQHFSSTKTAPLVALRSSNIKLPHTCFCVFELVPPSVMKKKGMAIRRGDSFLLRHHGTGGLVIFDISTDEASSLSIDSEPSADEVRHSVYTFGAALRSEEGRSSVYGSDLVRIMMHGGHTMVVQMINAELRAHHMLDEKVYQARSTHERVSVFQLRLFRPYDARAAKRLELGSSIRLFHAEQDRFLTACDPCQNEEKHVALQENTKNLRLRGRVYNSNRLFVVMNADVNRQGLGGWVRGGDVFRLYNLATDRYLALQSCYLK
eukprot:SAG11_NODE_3385_length_2481_cov_2.969773_2_plen_333_part_00